MTICEFVKVVLGLRVHTWIGQEGSGKGIWDKTYFQLVSKTPPGMNAPALIGEEYLVRSRTVLSWDVTTTRAGDVLPHLSILKIGSEKLHILNWKGFNMQFLQKGDCVTFSPAALNIGCARHLKPRLSCFSLKKQNLKKSLSWQSSPPQISEKTKLNLSSRYIWKIKWFVSISSPTHHLGFKRITGESRWSLAGSSTPSHSDVRRLDLNMQNSHIYMYDADLAKENPISSQQHPALKGLKCGPALRREEYPKEQQSLSADSCNDWLDLVWLLSLVKSPRQKSSWQNLSNILTPLFAGCCLHSSWQPSPVLGLKRKRLLLVIVTALLAARWCQGKETDQQGPKRIQPLPWSTHTPSQALITLSPPADVCQAKQGKAKQS